VRIQRAPAACVAFCSQWVSTNKEISGPGTQNHWPVFISPPPPATPNPGCIYIHIHSPQKPQAAAPASPSPAPQIALRAQKRLRHHPAEVLVCLERGATGPYLPFAPFHRQHPGGSLARPRRPPRGGLGLSRSKISAPWGVQSRLEPWGGGGKSGPRHCPRGEALFVPFFPRSPFVLGRISDSLFAIALSALVSGHKFLFPLPLAAKIIHDGAATEYLTDITQKEYLIR
jgi:hypothetical protein